MVHNGIEYGLMQLIAETYDILRQRAGLTAPQIADVFDTWNRGDLSSFLISRWSLSTITRLYPSLPRKMEAYLYSSPAFPTRSPD